MAQWVLGTRGLPPGAKKSARFSLRQSTIRTKRTVDFRGGMRLQAQRVQQSSANELRTRLQRRRARSCVQRTCRVQGHVDVSLPTHPSFRHTDNAIWPHPPHPPSPASGRHFRGRELARRRRGGQFPRRLSTSCACQHASLSSFRPLP
jgi:hypothetical protein